MTTTNSIQLVPALEGIPVCTPGAEPRLRVLQVVISLTPGGTERLVIEIAKRLLPHVETSVCCLDDAGAWADELTVRGVDVIALGRRPGFHPSLANRIVQLVDRFGADVMHCHQFSPFVYGSLAAVRRPRLRMIFTEHGRFMDSGTWKRWLTNRVLGRRPDRVFAVSADLGRHLVSEGFPGSAVQVAPNGIDPGPEVTEAARRQARQALSLSSRAVAFGTVARLAPVKDLTTLVDAFVSVRVAVPEARLVIVGDGPERERLETLARRLGIADAVILAGLRSDARMLMPGFDVYVNSSRYEGMSLTILEAMAASLPIVATRVGGNPEIVLDGWTGVLVPSRDPDALAAAMRTLVASADQRKAMGLAGRARVVREFSMTRMLDRYLDAYRRGE
jgi:glycosyltransferase involved in cell wall biosynthesis